MEQEKKIKLLTEDLCGRLPYSTVIVQYNNEEYNLLGICFGRAVLVKPFMSNISASPLIEEVKPYLRSITSMTGKEKEDYEDVVSPFMDKALEEALTGTSYDYTDVASSCDCRKDAISAEYRWLMENMFDVNGLIEKGLALEATEEMYKYDK